MNIKYYVNYMKKNAMFILITMVLIVASSLLLSLTVKSKETSSLSSEAHYQLLEKQMVKDVRHYLDENGYKNSGITLTRVVDDENQTREYTLTLHHDKMDRMEEEEREILGQTVLQFGFEFTTCSFETAYMLN